MMTDYSIVHLWWDMMKGKDMNLSLIQRPKRVSASSDTLYIYAPSVLMEGNKLKAKTIIKVLEVYKGSTPEETTLKVMENSVWQDHYRHHQYRYGPGPKNKDKDNRCKLMLARRGEYDGEERPKCVCESPIEDMPEEMEKATHFVLLSDIGK